MDVRTSGLQWNRYWPRPEALYASMSMKEATEFF
jgi:hypothetical protein